jgi:hypothetical protein
MSALPLLVLGVALADDPRNSVALDHLAMLADRFHAAANFHGCSNSYGKSRAFSQLAETAREMGKPFKIRRLERLGKARKAAATPLQQ